MTNKKANRYKNRHENNNNPTPKVQIDEESLLKQCLQLHQLLKNRTAKMRQLNSGDFCYILSTKWLREWKDYVGYEQATGDQQQDKHYKKDKKYGRRHPGKINTDILAFANQTRQFYALPKEMKEYDYLQQIINEKKQKDDDYIAVTHQIWFTFLQYYEGEEIRRPVKRFKTHTYYEGNPLRLDTIFVNLQDEQLQQKIKKTSKKLYNTIFPSEKMMLPTLWTFKQMETFLSQYCKHTYGFSKIRIWKGFSYTATNPIIENLVQSINHKKYLIKGRLITGERYQQFDLDDYLKSTHTLIVQIGEALKTDEQEDQNLKGYCEQCIQKKQLVISCVCNEVIYCSKICRVNDQQFHFKTCKLAFDSQDDQQYDKKATDLIPISGLNNLGNTCYMNSVLQTIWSLDYFRNFFSNNQYLKHMNEKELKQNNCLMLRKFSKTIKSMIQQEKYYPPWCLKGQIDYNLPPFKGYKQHDANDFFINFINVINDFLSKEGQKAYSKLIQPFVGQFHSTVICPLCNIKSQNNQIFTQLSLPIKSKVKQQTYSYCIVQSINKITRGKINVSQTWEEMKKNLKLSNKTLVFTNKEPEGLALINQQERKPENVAKSMKGELIYFKDFQIKEGEQMFVFNLVTIKTLLGQRAKSPYGTSTILTLIDIQHTLGSFWLQIIKKYFWHNEQIVAQATEMKKQYFYDIEEAVKSENAQKMKEKELTKPEQTPENEDKQSELCNKIAETYNTKLKLFADKIGIDVYVIDIKKIKSFCTFCKKKCKGCDLPKIFDKGFEDFFDNKYKQVRFEVYLRDQIPIDIIQQDLSSSGEPNIHDCLCLFNQPEQLDEQNAWYCSNCDNMALALKEMEVKMFPPILILHLNRFKNVDGKKMKNSDPINYDQFEHFGNNEYRLISAIIHEGSMQAGHYWSISLRGDQYYVFNDAKVTPIEKVFNRNAYILLYAAVNFAF